MAGFVVSDETRKLRCLQRPTGGVIVERVTLLLSLIAGLHPFQIAAEPLLQRGALFSREHGGRHSAGGSCDFDKMKSVDDAVGAAGGDAMNSLGELEVRVHMR